MGEESIKIIETEKSIVRLHGKPNFDNWARKIKQVLDDLEAGRYKEEEAV